MKLHEIKLAENGISSEKATDILIPLIDNQISNLNRIKFIEWERNRANKENNLDEAVNYLTFSKTDLKAKLKQLETSNSRVSYTISIEIATEDK